MASSFTFPDNVQPGMLFDSLESIRQLIKEQAVRRNLPLFLFCNRKGNGNRVGLSCKLCKAALNFVRGSEGWRATIIRNEHSHPQHTERVFSSKLKLNANDLREMSYEFPTTVAVGMRFLSLEEISNALDKEAYERKLPEKIYVQKNGGLQWCCKICQSNIAFVKGENGFEVTKVTTHHTHGQEELERYKQGKEKNIQRYRRKLRRRREVSSSSSNEESISQEASQEYYVPKVNAVDARKKLNEVPEHEKWEESLFKVPRNLPVDKLDQPNQTVVAPLVSLLQSLRCKYKIETEEESSQEMSSLVFATREMLSDYASRAENGRINLQFFHNLISDPPGTKVGLFSASRRGISPCVVGVALLAGRIESSWESLLKSFLELHGTGKTPTEVLLNGIQSTHKYGGVEKKKQEHPRAQKQKSLPSFLSQLQKMGKMFESSSHSIYAERLSEVSTHDNLAAIDKLRQDMIAQLARLRQEQESRQMLHEHCQNVFMRVQQVCPAKIQTVDFINLLERLGETTTKPQKTNPHTITEQPVSILPTSSTVTTQPMNPLSTPEPSQVIIKIQVEEDYSSKVTAPAPAINEGRDDSSASCWKAQHGDKASFGDWKIGLHSAPRSTPN